MVRVTIQDNPVKHLHDNTDIWSLQGSPNGPRYQRDILVNVVPHNHDLATRPVFKDYNAGPHRTRQWWISYSKMQPLPFLVQHEVPTSIQLRTCVAFWINAYVREILPSKRLQNCQQHCTRNGGQSHNIRSKVWFGAREHVQKRSYESAGVRPDIELLKISWQFGPCSNMKSIRTLLQIISK